jgi:hypothetical protein
MLPENLPQSQRIFCNQCRTITNHFLKGSHRKEEERDTGYWRETDFLFWICAGCDSAILEERFTDANIAYEYVADFSPPPNLYHLPDKVFTKLPSKLIHIYREIIRAFNNDLHILAAAGLRALIEGICFDKKISGRNLDEKINHMNTILPENIVSNLHGFRFMGNEAIHELEIPRLEDLKLAISVSEDLLNFLYELDYKASRLPKARKVAKPKTG